MVIPALPEGTEELPGRGQAESGRVSRSRQARPAEEKHTERPRGWRGPGA